MDVSDTEVVGLEASPRSPAIATPARRLNVGCGRNIKPASEGWVNLDGRRGDGVDVVFDLENCGPGALSFDDGHFDEILVSHVLEHIWNVLPLMQELWRIARPHALMTIRVPYGSSDDAWEDPTHLRGYFVQSFGYFGMPYHWRSDLQYTADWKAEEITLFVPTAILDTTPEGKIGKRIHHERNIVREMVCTLRKIDPPRPADRALVAVPPIRIEAI